MKVETFVDIVNCDFYTGVPDSQLRALCDYLMAHYGIDSKHHVIAANEGNCVGLACGYYLATGKVPVVYMQNSGVGNATNPILSLLNEEIYGIPMVFVIGWRGEPGTQDEPQHIYQGKVTLNLLDDIGIEYVIIEENTTAEELRQHMNYFRGVLANGRCVAFVIRKNALYSEKNVNYCNTHTLKREDAIDKILEYAQKDLIISTTGKISRELYELREKHGEGHQLDFMTVGSMGHCSSIALGVALQKAEKRIWCFDGDGALLMHMGALAVIGSFAPRNLVHVVLNNEAHESVGGMPTVAGSVNMIQIAKACGYPYVACAESIAELSDCLKEVNNKKALSFIEIKCAVGSRSDLGRPQIVLKENRREFMRSLM